MTRPPIPPHPHPGLLAHLDGLCREEEVNKVQEGRPHIVDMIKNDEIDLILNTVEGRQATRDSSSIRRSAENHRVYYNTTLAASQAVCMALKQGQHIQVRRLQDLHQQIKK